MSNVPPPARRHTAREGRLVLLLVSLALAACATPVILMKNEATGEMATCGGNTIGSMEGRSTEQASDEACVREWQAKGFRRTSHAELQFRQSQGRIPDAAPVTRPPTVPVESRWLLNAGALARQSGCASPLVTLTGKAAGTERLSAACANGTALLITCDFDGCRIVP